MRGKRVSDRGSFMALCIPATIFSIGCFYVFGSLEHLHGATPSERTFLGVIPMFTSTNLGHPDAQECQLETARAKVAQSICRSSHSVMAATPSEKKMR